MSASTAAARCSAARPGADLARLHDRGAKKRKLRPVPRAEASRSQPEPFFGKYATTGAPGGGEDPLAVNDDAAGPRKNKGQEAGRQRQGRQEPARRPATTPPTQHAAPAPRGAAGAAAGDPRVGAAAPASAVRPLGRRELRPADPSACYRPRRMAKEEKVEFEGEVVEALPNAMFRVKLDNDHMVLGHVAGKMRRYRIRILPGDRVRVELSPYDLDRARIVYRHR